MDTRLCISALVSTALLVGCGAEPSESDVGDARLRLTAELDPSPPRVARHTLTLHVKDAEGHPVSGAVVTAYAEMPLHSHASNEDPESVERGAGEYVLSPITFTMPGRWQVHVVAASDEGETARDFTYEVE